MVKDSDVMKKGTSFSFNGVDDESDAERLCVKHGITKDIVDRLRVSHTRLWVLDSLPIVFRAATKVEWSRFSQKAESKDKLGAIEELACAVVVYPDRAGREALFDQYPLIPARIIGDLGSEAQAEQAEHSKKL